MSMFGKLFHKKKELEPGELTHGDELPPMDTSGMPPLGHDTPGMPPMSDMPSSQPSEAAGGLGYPSLEPARAPSAPPQHMAQQQSFESSSSDKDFQIVNAKLDAIRATLENMNQRIANLERIAAEGTEQKW